MAGSKAALYGLVLGLSLCGPGGTVKTPEIRENSVACVALERFSSDRQGGGCVEFTRTETFNTSHPDQIPIPRWAEVALMVPGALVYLVIGFYGCMALAVLVIRDDRVFGNQRSR